MIKNEKPLLKLKRSTISALNKADIPALLGGSISNVGSECGPTQMNCGPKESGWDPMVPCPFA